MLTDYALAALAVAFAIRLRPRAVSATVGSGTGSQSTLGQPPWTYPAAGTVFWRLAFSVASLAALAGGTYHGFRLYLGEAVQARVWQLTVGLIALSALLTLGAAIRSVLWPAVPAGEARAAGHRWLQLGLVVTLAGLAVQQSGWVFYPNFNHNDLYHLVQMVGLYCLYRGARRLEGLVEINGERFRGGER